MAELGRLSKEKAISTERLPISLVLDALRSMNNVGAIFRTADAFLAEKIWLCGHTPCPPHREIEKTALGATESVPWEHADNVVELIRNLKNKNIKIFSIEQTLHSTPLEKLHSHLSEPCAFILGNEVYGIKQEAIDLSDEVFEIPQFGHKHSFNVSVSAGIVLWEWFRSRSRQKKSMLE
ncbi:MAG: RNA methyltransferase [Bacteroidia bacterium]|nr:RNA methyltransferase [Bacteroidia bacterium]